MYLEELQSTIRRNDSLEIAQSAVKRVKRNAIYVVTAGCDLIGTVEG